MPSRPTPLILYTHQVFATTTNHSLYFQSLSLSHGVNGIFLQDLSYRLHLQALCHYAQHPVILYTQKVVATTANHCLYLQATAMA